MIKRIVEISNPAYLHLRNNQMVIEQNGAEAGTVPIEDLGVLILDHPAISHTQDLFTACAENNVAILISDRKHLPCALVLPIEGHHLQSKTIAQQIQISEPTRKRLWQSIVKAKIREQANVLQLATGESHPLAIYVDKVRSGDPDNMEAQAARIYWKKLFGQDFRRDPEGTGINILLNYGYMVLRAAVARAVVGAGLHPSLGLKHHNQYNGFCLADDLVEPFRPLVDRKVYALWKRQPEELDLKKETKLILLENLSRNCTINNQPLPLMVALHHYAAGIRKVIIGESKDAVIPGL